MPLRSIKSFEDRWGEVRKMARAQLRDFEKDKRYIAREIRRYKIKKDLYRLRDAIARSRRVEQVVRATKVFIATKGMVLRQAKRGGRLLARAVT